MKMLATGAVYADEVWIGNLTPIDDKRKSESDHRALPLNTPGVSFWARQPYARHAAPRGRLSAVLPVRRDRHACWSATASRFRGSACLPAQQCSDVAAHLHRDAGELLPEPPIEHPVLGQDGTDRRAREPHLPGERHRQDPGGARDARPACRARSDHRRAGARPDRGLRAMARRLRHAQPPHHVCGAQLVPGAPHRDHRHAAHACWRGVRC